MSENSKNMNLDDAVAFLVIQKLVSPIEKSEAFKNDLVDKTGKIIKFPETDEEKEKLTTLDKFVFKLKRLLGNKLSELNNFMYLHTVDSSIYRNLYVRGNMEQKSEIKRVKAGLDKLSEELSIPIDKMIKLYAYDLIKENTK